MAFKILNEVKVGVLVFIAICLAILGYHFLQGKNYFESRNMYYVVYDKVDGLVESSPVLINGLKVGLVTEISFTHDTLNRIFVKMLVDNEYQIPDSSIAEIYSVDLMGSKAIRLNLTKLNKFYKSGDTLYSKIEQDLKSQVSAQMLPLKVKAEELILSIDSVMSVVQNIFNENTRENLSKTFASIKETIKNLESASISLDTLMRNEKYVLARIFSNIESITNNLKNNNEQINQILNNFSMISDSLQKSNIKNTIQNANTVLLQANSILGKINRGEGSFGLLINNDTLYRNLENASKNLDKLMQDLRENPKRYVRFSLFDFGRTVIIDENGNKIKKRERNNQTDTSGSTSDNTIIYKVQIRSAKKQIKPNSQEFKGINNVEENFIDGRYKYTIGRYSTLDDAIKEQQEILNIFPDAFVVSFQGKQQVPIQDVRK
ncbi:MAG: MCE family protein [Bacteroidetes bacterium CG_4_10_14_3_um_filter_31_20]|nr:MAG: MCE family protein [Bacteroidetes bacterium CG_4_10_14_3_um_filter_31_20]